jgi:hypothetical protein
MQIVEPLQDGGAGEAPVVEVKRRGKMAISAEPATAAATDVVLTHHPKSPGAKQLIKDAVQANDFLRQLAHEQVWDPAIGETRIPADVSSRSSPRSCIDCIPSLLRRVFPHLQVQLCLLAGSWMHRERLEMEPSHFR